MPNTELQNTSFTTVEMAIKTGGAASDVFFPVPILHELSARFGEAIIVEVNGSLSEISTNDYFSRGLLSGTGTIECPACPEIEKKVNTPEYRWYLAYAARQAMKLGCRQVCIPHTNAEKTIRFNEDVEADDDELLDIRWVPDDPEQAAIAALLPATH